MNIWPASVDQNQAAPILAARLQDLSLSMHGPLMGRLTDEQRALCLGIARRSMVNVAAQIDSNIPADLLWQDWLHRGIPITDAWVASCFARAEEHRWRTQQGSQASFQAADSRLGADGSKHPPRHNMPRYGNRPEVADAYLQLQLADRRRFDPLGYPALAIADLPDEVYRHLLNEVARWRLRDISRDMRFAADLGQSVRRAWEGRGSLISLDDSSRLFYERVIASHPLSDEANQAVARQDWLAFIALASGVQDCSYPMMVTTLLTANFDALAAWLESPDALGLRGDNLAALEACLADVRGAAALGEARE